MKFNFYMMPALLTLGLAGASSVWAANCDPTGNPNFYLIEASSSSGSISCYQTEAKNIQYSGSDVQTNPGSTTLFSGVTDLTGNVHGIVNGAPQTGGFGSFTIDASVWNSWSSIYIALKQGNGYGLFLLTQSIVSGTWKTAPGAGTDLSHYIAFGGAPVTPTPLPAAVWLFGAGLAGLIGTARRKSKTAI